MLLIHNPCHQLRIVLEMHQCYVIYFVLHKKLVVIQLNYDVLISHHKTPTIILSEIYEKKLVKSNKYNKYIYIIY